MLQLNKLEERSLLAKCRTHAQFRARELSPFFHSGSAIVRRVVKRKMSFGRKALLWPELQTVASTNNEARVGEVSHTILERPESTRDPRAVHYTPSAEPSRPLRGRSFVQTCIMCTITL